ncbi:LytTR family transcriptional regulator [Lentilactobacillus sp. IMAU92037]|uniref:LytTR family DNA-binding domain-containing protein n=1 Tax=Lentilactobacillus TaxID=2767893 RepID=UPI001C27F9EA|nr:MULTISPECIES: LytTR family DNA-binding domain-containing protein [Lentilactobacillus]MBU9790271.1 LytTR family transcriptional regulator [Lentilactobacillus dabitei]MBV0929515.1 LytTR family transcriptional regulator [Lentilactobacillus dabitei]MDM7517192.1 LytTR family DNA-binding domain-containing protein [Lentilactobacillus sp. TOM.63]
MKVRVEIDDDLQNKEIVIRTPKYDAEVSQLVDVLNAQTREVQSLVFYKGDSEYYLDPSDILFFETENRQVHAHTVDDEYVIHHRLYELEMMLTGEFIRISKSAIINLHNILSLTRSVAGVVVKFQDSNKQVYVSRRYYRPLKDRLERRG